MLPENIFWTCEMVWLLPAEHQYHVYTGNCRCQNSGNYVMMLYPFQFAFYYLGMLTHLQDRTDYESISNIHTLLSIILIQKNLIKHWGVMFLNCNIKWNKVVYQLTPLSCITQFTHLRVTGFGSPIKPPSDIFIIKSWIKTYNCMWCSDLIPWPEETM